MMLPYIEKLSLFLVQLISVIRMFEKYFCTILNTHVGSMKYCVIEQTKSDAIFTNEKTVFS